MRARLRARQVRVRVKQRKEHVKRAHRGKRTRGVCTHARALARRACICTRAPARGERTLSRTPTRRPTIKVQASGLPIAAVERLRGRLCGQATHVLGARHVQPLVRKPRQIVLGDLLHQDLGLCNLCTHTPHQYQDSRVPAQTPHKQPTQA
jgi:hypothetical protein